MTSKVKFLGGSSLGSRLSSPLEEVESERIVSDVVTRLRGN